MPIPLLYQGDLLRQNGSQLRESQRLLTEHYGTGIEHIELGYHDYKNGGLPDWLVRDSAAFGVDELASSYTDDFDKLTGK
jgi:hypothetical protein